MTRSLRRESETKWVNREEDRASVMGIQQAVSCGEGSQSWGGLAISLVRPQGEHRADLRRRQREAPAKGARLIGKGLTLPAEGTDRSM